MKAIRRDKLQRDIEAGKMEAQRAHARCTDDAWEPAFCVPAGHDGSVCNGAFFFPCDFTSKYCRAYTDGRGAISFRVMGGILWRLRYKAQELPDAEARRTHEEDHGDYYVPKAIEGDH